MSDPVQWYWEGDKQAVSVSWLVQDFFAEKSVGLIVGESQAGKTFLALDLAVAVASGRQFFGKRVTKGGGVVHCCRRSDYHSGKVKGRSAGFASD